MQEFNLNSDKEIKNIIIGKLKRMFSSSNIDILLGSAFSMPYLMTLSDIEKRLSKAMESSNKTEEYEIKKEFFQKSIYPILDVKYNDNKFEEKRVFLKTLSDIIDLRETSLVHKIINIFTTNYDDFIEVSLETNHIDYFDGFAGRMCPEFSTSNYGKLVCKQTELTGRVSETVSVNLFKIHGSLLWKQENDKIFFEDYKTRIESIGKAKTQNEFLKKYDELAIINPEKNKFNSTVMNSNYYDQIRMFANELERQNTILITFGFSFADEHIIQIVNRTLSSNPTLTLLLFPYCQQDLNNFREQFKIYNNVYCYYDLHDTEEKIKNFDLQALNSLLQEIYYAIK